MKRIAVAAVVFVLTAAPVAGADPDPNMPTGPNDPRCATMPWVAQCVGSPFAPPTPPPPPALPTGPLDPQCMQMPADAACTGSPYVPPPPPPMPMEPPMGGGMSDMPGMPGHI